MGRIATVRDRVVAMVCGVFVLANIFVPLPWGDLYPFSVVPMFRDAPLQYCAFTVRDVDGNDLSLEDFRLHRIYDGNPIAMGAGIQTPPSLDRFEDPPPAEELVAHVEERLRVLGRWEAVDVTLEVVGPTQDGGVGVVRRESWRVRRP